MKCPIDKMELVRSKYLNNSVFECQKCKGMLISSTAPPAQLYIKNKYNINLSSSELNCSYCQLEMKAFAYEGVEIDICPSCKTVWLDAGEEKKVLTRKKVDYGMYVHTEPEQILLEFVFEAIERTLDTHSYVKSKASM